MFPQALVQGFHRPLLAATGDPEGYVPINAWERLAADSPSVCLLRYPFSVFRTEDGQRKTDDGQLHVADQVGPNGCDVYTGEFDCLVA